VAAQPAAVLISDISISICGHAEKRRKLSINACAAGPASRKESKKQHQWQPIAVMSASKLKAGGAKAESEESRKHRNAMKASKYTLKAGWRLLAIESC